MGVSWWKCPGAECIVYLEQWSGVMMMSSCRDTHISPVLYGVAFTPAVYTAGHLNMAIFLVSLLIVLLRWRSGMGNSGAQIIAVSAGLPSSQ